MSIKNADWTFSHIGDLDAMKGRKSNPLAFRKQVIYAGATGANGEDLEIDEDLIDHWVGTGTQMLSEDIDITVPPHHTNNDETSRGKITKFEKARDSKGRVSLFLSGEANNRSVLKKMSETDVSLYSPVIAKKGGKLWPRPILHACLTDRPVVKGMDRFQLALSYDGDDKKMKVCPTCKRPMGKMKDGINKMKGDRKKRVKGRRQLLAFSEVDDYVDKLHEETGEGKFFVVPQDGKHLVLCKSQMTDDLSASLVMCR